MLIRFFFAGCLALGWLAVTNSPSFAQTASSDREIRTLRLDTNAAITKSKSAVDCELTAAIVDLCSLHAELVIHGRFATSGVLAGARARIASRLNDLERDLEKGLEKSAESDSMDSEKYAQLRMKERLMTQHIRITGAQLGGPAYEGLALTGNFAPGDDWGNELINLIRQTIDPGNWQGNGGEAVIAYWQPSRVLVVSASMLTHDKIESLLIGLRRK